MRNVAPDPVNLQLIVFTMLLKLLSFINPYGGPGGHCPRVLNPFLSTSYSLKLAPLSEYPVLTADPS